MSASPDTIQALRSGGIAQSISGIANHYFILTNYRVQHGQAFKVIGFVLVVIGLGLAWVLGNARFKQRIQKQLERRVEPSAKGGDRKSGKFRINGPVYERLTYLKFFAWLLSSVITFTAHAANVDIQPAPDLPLSNVPPAPTAMKVPTADGWKFSVGGGVSHAPSYEGAARDRLRFMPMFEASYNRGKIFVSPLRGIGYNFSEAKELQYGVRLAVGRPREEGADSRLYGMGDIGFIPEYGVFFNQRFALWFISGGITTGNHGSHLEMGGGIGLPLSVADRLRLAISLNRGDQKYNQTYFGVTAAQAAASGNVLTAYEAGDGIKDYAFTVNWAHTFNQEWFSTTGLSYKWLAGSAAQSPLTERSAASSAYLTLGYRF